MKKIILFSIVFCILGFLKAQQIDKPSKLAQHIAEKMTDSLGLDVDQKEKLIKININLSAEKAAILKEVGETDYVQKELQKIESTRDRRYEKVLTQEQYTLYLQKKRNLVSAN